MKPSVAIVILNWNGRKYLEQFLPSVIASGYENFNVIVVDNASTDDSISFLNANYPNIEIIHHGVNLGFAKGYNLALEDIEADYYVLLNSDVEVVKGWIDPMISLLERDPRVAACGPKLLLYHNRELFEYSGASGGWLDQLGYPFARGRIFDHCEKDEGQYNTTEPIFWASGAALCIRSNCFHEVNGFDEFFFAHQEEIDLCWRLQLAGYSIYSCPDSVVYHVGGGTLPKGNSRKVFLNFRNNLVMMAKNLPAWKAIIKIIYRFFLDGISAVKSLLAGQGTYFLAVIKAHFAFLGWLIAGSGKSVFPLRKDKPLRGYLKKSIVWQHFVLGRKKFSDIVKK